MNHDRTALPTRRWRLGLRLSAVVAAAVLTVALAAAALDQAKDSPTSATSVAASSSEADVGDVVTPLQASAIDGRSVTVPGERPTVLFFMAAWCSSCREGARAMASLEDHYAAAAKFVAVNLTPSDTPAAVDEFRRAAGGKHPYVIDSDGQFLTHYAVQALDTTVVVAPDGRVVARIDSRPLNDQELRSFLDKALT